MRWSEKHRVWCVQPRHYTNWMDVVRWCSALYGPGKLDSDDGSDIPRRKGCWGWANGSYYGFDYSGSGAYSDLPNRQLYFCFDSKEDALPFILTWGELE